MKKKPLPHETPTNAAMSDPWTFPAYMTWPHDGGERKIPPEIVREIEERVRTWQPGETEQARTLLDVARVVRREHPRKWHVAGLLEYMHRNPTASFSELKFHVHESEYVEDTTVVRNVRETQKEIVKSGLPIRLVVSGAIVSRKDLSE